MEALVAVEDTGLGSDVVVSITFTLTDSGLGEDFWDIQKQSDSHRHRHRLRC